MRVAYQAMHATSAPADLILILQHGSQVGGCQAQLIPHLAAVLALPVLGKLQMPGSGSHLCMEGGANSREGTLRRRQE